MLPSGCLFSLYTHLFLTTCVCEGRGQRDHVLFASNASNSRPIAAFQCGLDTALVKQVGSDSMTILEKACRGCRVE